MHGGDSGAATAILGKKAQASRFCVAHSGGLQCGNGDRGEEAQDGGF